jgi:P27 family predicted phage terminase small subunit
MRGRKPVPTSVKRQRGTYRPDRDHGPDPLEPAAMAVQLPAELEGDARAVREWQRLAPILIEARQITEADRSALIAYCLEWSRYIKASRNAARENYRATNGRHSVWFSVQRHALTACLKLSAELGLTPSARTRIPNASHRSALNGPDAMSEFDSPEPTRPN